MFVRPFPGTLVVSVLGTMASADPSRFNPAVTGGVAVSDGVPARSPQVSVCTFTPCNRRIYADAPVRCRTLAFFAVSSSHPRLICGFCSSVQGFASDFLRIPPRGGHPCLWLTVPTVKPVGDFHPRVQTHAGRTKTAAPRCLSHTFYSPADHRNSNVFGPALTRHGSLADVAV